MKRLKSIFNVLYFLYLGISLLLFVFWGAVVEQVDQEILFRFINFWLILGFVFFISIWIIQAVHIGFLKKDVGDLESKVLELKGKLYDFGRVSESVEQRNPKQADPPLEETK